MGEIVELSDSIHDQQYILFQDFTTKAHRDSDQLSAPSCFPFETGHNLV